MPLILQNSHSHEFTYTNADGQSVRVSLKRGDAVPEDVPVPVITRLVAETVIAFNGDTVLPRYVHVADTDAGDRTHRTGAVSVSRQDRDFATQAGANKSSVTEDEIAEALAKAEAEAELEAQRAVDAEAAAEAAAEQLAREAAEEAARVEEAAEAAAAAPVDVKAELRAQLAELGVSAHPAAGEAKLREKLAEARAAAEAAGDED